MANSEHQAVLNQGVDAWNQWRKKNPYIQPNLSEANLSESDLSGANLAKADIRLANFSESNLRNAIFTFTDASEAVFEKADLSETDFRVANLERAELVKVNLSGANLSEAKLYRADLSRAELSRANLSMANLSWANLSSANLSEANLSKAILTNANLYKAKLFKTNLCTANLSNAYLMMACLHSANLFSANLSDANLTEADLVHADLRWAEIFQANLAGAKLSNADLSFAKLLNVNLFQANLFGARFQETEFNQMQLENTYLINIDLSSVIGLDVCRHSGPSIIDHRTLVRSKNLPIAFLRGCGLPENLILAYQTMHNDTPLFSDCYISCSEEDIGFTLQLYRSLQQKNVRCWIIRNSMKTGDQIRHIIEERIRDQEKMIVIFSKNFMEGSWVQKELETAFQKEGELNRSVLIPISLDSSYLEANETIFADIRATRHYHDFREWQNSLKLENATSALLRSLEINIME